MPGLTYPSHLALYTAECMGLLEVRAHAGDKKVEAPGVL
jgi:hypothetical protein